MGRAKEASERPDNIPVVSRVAVYGQNTSQHHFCRRCVAIRACGKEKRSKYYYILLIILIIDDFHNASPLNASPSKSEDKLVSKRVN